MRKTEMFLLPEKNIEKAICYISFRHAYIQKNAPSLPSSQDILILEHIQFVLKHKMLEFMKNMVMDGNNKFLSSKSKSFFYHQSQNYIIPSISEAFFDRQS
jgi:hypothetical protein